jgi:5'-phosphate synthase pdxT subunit
MPFHIGILALQGAFREHQQSFDRLNQISESPEQQSIECHYIRRADHLDSVSMDGLVLPGGESTAMRILADGKLRTRMRSLFDDGLPGWVLSIHNYCIYIFLFKGTCAGMIWMASNVQGDTSERLLPPGLDVLVQY